jgi:formiminoglutamase
MKSFFTKTPDSIFTSRGDLADPRLGDFRVTEPSTANFSCWGYPDDEGIRLGGGRPGASLGPQGIREIFYKMTPPLTQNRVAWKIFDAGDFKVDLPLSARHENVRQFVKEQTRAGRIWISLGGGHDYGYCDGAGFIEGHLVAGQPRPLILSFDAHLDVRPLDRGLTSGTPFFRILQEFKSRFDFVEIGIQEHCNARAHLDFVQSHGGQVISLAALRERGCLEALTPVLEPFAGRQTFLSVDIDVFANSEAPGCSQSWPGGLTFQEFFKSLLWMQTNLKLQGLGLYEVSPPLDLGLRTQRLAALIMYEFMKGHR